MIVAGERVERIDLALAEPGSRSYRVNGLTAEDVALLRLVAEGRTNDEIAAALPLERRAVARRLTRLYGKIGVGSRPAAISYAFKNGFGLDAR